MRKLYMLLLGAASYRVPLLINLASRDRGLIGRLRSKICRLILERSHGFFLGRGCHVPTSVKFPHPVGIVIGAGAQIGEEVTIFQHVTLGSARLGGAADNEYPTIGRGSVIYSSAQILGAVKIGKNCRIGAGSVVIADVPDDCTVVGVPGRIVQRSVL